MSILGHVRSADGRPLAEARVYYEDSPVPMPDVAALSGPEGQYELSTPAVGTYTIGAAMDGYASSSVTVDVGPQERAQADIALEPVSD